MKYDSKGVSYLPRHQTTVNSRIDLTGIGVHRGSPVSIAINPAEQNTGIVFMRTDNGMDGIDIPASYKVVCATEQRTVIGHCDSNSIATIEHLMAALQGLGVDNAIIEVDGDEIPVMDGSSARFVDAIDETGIRTLDAPRRYIRVLRPIRVDKGAQFGELLPHDGFELDITIDFENPLIGRQQLIVEVTPDCFRNELSRARTFGFMHDVEKFWAAGLALGASLENAIVIKDEKVLNQEGLRFADEFVRHKALDALGDLALAGAPILGKYRSLRGGHKLNNEVLTALLDQPDAWCYENIPAPREKVVGASAGSTVGVSVPAFGPDVS